MPIARFWCVFSTRRRCGRTQRRRRHERRGKTRRRGRAVEDGRGRNGVGDPRRLAEAFRESLVAHKCLVVPREPGRVFAQPRLHAAVAPDNLAVRAEAEAVVHVALQVLQEAAEPDLRLGRLPARGEGRAQGLERRAGVHGRTARNPPPLGGEGTATGVVARIVTGAVGARLETVHPVREAAPEAAEAPQVGDTECELEGDERAAEEERRLVQAQGLRVVDEGAVVRLRVPEAAGLPAPPARAGLRDGVVQLARARVRDIPDPPRPRVEEVALDPRAEALPNLLRDRPRRVRHRPPRREDVGAVPVAAIRPVAPVVRTAVSDFTAMVFPLLAAAQPSRGVGWTQ